MTIERKYFTGCELKADKPGSFTAKIAELNVIDKDGDVTIPGAFTEGKTILISCYQHSSWDGELPVGKGTIRVDGDDVFVDGEFNLKTVTGREHYETIKFAPELQEWSYGFSPTEFDRDVEFEGHAVARILKKLEEFEASPVLRGAGNNTGTPYIKSEDQGQTLETQAAAALTAVTDLTTRIKSLTDLRKSQGKTPLTEANITRMKSIGDQMRETLAEIDELTAEPKTEDLEELRKAAERVFAGYVRTKSKLAGVKI